MSACYICLEAIDRDNVTLCCGHQYCRVCITQWFRVNTICPRSSCNVRHEGPPLECKEVASSAFCAPCKELLLVCQMSEKTKRLSFSQLAHMNRAALCLRCDAVLEM